MCFKVFIHCYVTMQCCKTLAVEKTLVNESVGRSHAYCILSLVVGCSFFTVLPLQCCLEINCHHFSPHSFQFVTTHYLHHVQSNWESTITSTNV
jgi:uncharacterized membrane protein